MERLSLEELLEVPLTVAGSRARPLRESPAVVSVITREEIERSGARDLLDLLQRVPGFWPGVDVEGIVDVGFRGNWAHEGKVFLLIDGQEFNEELYSTLQLGHHVPVEHIRSIEILRGPGSVLYGGNAELAVINVITRDAGDLRGAVASVNAGQGGREFLHRTVSLQYGQVFPQLAGLELTLAGFAGQANRSGQDFVDANGVHFSMRRGAARTDPLFINASGRLRNLTLRAILDGYRIRQQDGSGVGEEVVPESFWSLHLEAKGVFEPLPGLTLTPRLAYKWEAPWRTRPSESASYYDKTDQRVSARFGAAYEFAPGMHGMAGAELQHLTARLNSPEGGMQTTFAGKNSVAYTNLAAFAELGLESVLGSLVAGVRLERHSAFGQSVVPRLTLTKVLDPLHFKLLFARSFRAPAVENINLGDDLRPELTRTLEAEVGVQPDPRVLLSINVFDITIDRTIVYRVDGDTEGYANQGKSGTRGLEAEFRARAEQGSLSMSYSVYTAANRNRVEGYAVPGQPRLLLAFPAHKVVLSGELLLGRDVSLDAAATWVSERFYLGQVNAAGEPQLQRLGPTLLADVFLQWRSVGGSGLDLSVGVHNLLDQPEQYLQPYAGGHPPLPGAGRELAARLTHRFEEL